MKDHLIAGDNMANEPSTQSTKSYGKHSKRYWIVIYVVGAIIVYGLIYLLFIHKSGGTGGSFNY
jgi:hypothetical protein